MVSSLSILPAGKYHKPRQDSLASWTRSTLSPSITTAATMYVTLRFTWSSIDERWVCSLGMSFVHRIYTHFLLLWSLALTSESVGWPVGDHFTNDVSSSMLKSIVSTLPYLKKCLHVVASSCFSWPRVCGLVLEWTVMKHWQTDTYTIVQASTKHAKHNVTLASLQYIIPVKVQLAKTCTDRLILKVKRITLVKTVWL